MNAELLSLENRITAVITAAGGSPVGSESAGPNFRVVPLDPAFCDAADAGLTVELPLGGGTASQRVGMLSQYATALRGDGLEVSHRGSHLFVAAPSES